MAEKVRNQIVVLEPCTQSVTDLLVMVKEKDYADIVMVKTPEETIQAVAGALPCLLILSLVDNNAVPSRVQMLKRLETSIKQHGLKVYMVTGIKNRQLSDLFTQKMGVTDYIVDPVAVRTMLFKINLAIKAVENFRKQQEAKRASQEQIVIKKFEAKKTEGAATADLAPKGKPALQMAEDTFLFKNGGAKKVGKKFVLEVEGPDPSTGEWQQHADKGDVKSAWRWVPNEEKEAQAAGKAPPDGWVHDGDKPSFNEESGKWALASENPALALKKAGKVVAEKISLDEKGELVVAEDSPAAIANLAQNRVKASAAIKQREEKNKVLSEKKKAIEKDALEEAKSNVLGDLSKEDKTESASLVPASDTDDKSSQLKKKVKPAKNGSAALTDLMNSVEADESDEPSEFNNKLDGKKEKLRSVVDKRDDHQLKNPAVPEAEAEADEVSPAAEPKKSSPLDFLKKKKEEAKQASLAQGVNTIKADAQRKGVNALKDGDEEEDGPSAGILNRKKGAKKGSAADRLARLKAGLEEEIEEENAQETEDYVSSEPRTEGGREIGMRQKAPEDDAKKRGGPTLKVNEGEEEAGKGSPKLKLQEKKKKTLEAIQAKLLAPLPEELTPEEEKEIREELGLEGRPEIKAKELARKKRLEEVKRMKDLLSEIDEELEQDGEVISNGLNSKDDEPGGARRKGDLSEEKLKGIRSALDGGELESFGEETEERRKLKNSSDEKKQRKGHEDTALYMPVAKLVPQGNAWESTGSHFVYLNAEVRYKGFGTFEDILPLWIFKGDRVPELLDKSKQWRFFGPLPLLAKTPAELPSDVREYLLAIRDQLKANGVEASGEEPGNSGELKSKKEKGKKAGGGNALERLKAQLAEGEEDPDAVARELSGEEEPEAEEEDLTATSKFKAGGELTLPGEELNGLKARRAKDKRAAEESTDDSSEQEPETDTEEPGKKTRAMLEKKGKKDSASAGMDMLARLREKMKASEAEETPDTEKPDPVRAEKIAAEAREDSSEENSDEEATERSERKLHQQEVIEEAEAEKEALTRKKKSKREDAPEEEEEDEPDSAGSASPVAKASKEKEPGKKAGSLDRLREQLGMDDPDPEAGDEAPADQESSESELTANAQSEASPGDKQETEAPAAQAMPGASDAVKKFMERRKAKATVKEALSRAKAVDPATKTVSVYLGLYVSLSDSLAQETNSDIALPKVLKAFEDSFGDCSALCTGLPDKENAAEVRYCPPGSPEALTRVQLNSGIFEPITTGDGGSDDLLGYLFLQARGARSVFTDAERATVKKIARKLWPILKRASLDTESEAA